MSEAQYVRGTPGKYFTLMIRRRSSGRPKMTSMDWLVKVVGEGNILKVDYIGGIKKNVSKIGLSKLFCTK